MRDILVLIETPTVYTVLLLLLVLATGWLWLHLPAEDR